jgi:hypothetical protein
MGSGGRGVGGGLLASGDASGSLFTTGAADETVEGSGELSFSAAELGGRPTTVAGIGEIGSGVGGLVGFISGSGMGGFIGGSRKGSGVTKSGRLGSGVGADILSPATGAVVFKLKPH